MIGVRERPYSHETFEFSEQSYLLLFPLRHCVMVLLLKLVPVEGFKWGLGIRLIFFCLFVELALFTRGRREVRNFVFCVKVRRVSGRNLDG